MTTQPLNGFQNNSYSPTQLFLGAAMMSASGAAAAAIFTTIAPAGGAVFGGASFLSSRLIDWIANTSNCCPHNPIFRTAKCVLSTLGGIAVGAMITTAAGFPMTFAAGTVLTIGSIGTAIGITLVLGGCLCSSALATGTAMALSFEEPGVRV